MVHFIKYVAYDDYGRFVQLCDAPENSFSFGLKGDMYYETDY